MCLTALQSKAKIAACLREKKTERDVSTTTTHVEHQNDSKTSGNTGGAVMGLIKPRCEPLR